MMKLAYSELIPDQTVIITGSKSLSNRLLILDALFASIRLINTSNSQDTQIVKAALQNEAETIDVHHAGTAMRFLTAYFATQDGVEKILTGSDRMKERPIAPLVEALRKLGASIEYLEKEGYPPLKIKGKTLTNNKTSIVGNISSQFITALLLIAPYLPDGLELELEGELTSVPYLNMTLHLLKGIDVDARKVGNTINIKPYIKEHHKRLVHFTIESDWSSASYYYSLAALGKETIRLKYFKNNSLQGDAIIQELYWKYFGINTIADASENEIYVSYPDPLFEYPEKISLNMNQCPDIAQTLCVTAAALQIPFEINGLHTLKVKETDRLQALKNELKKIGCITEITDDSITSVDFVHPEESIVIETYNDHRMAMSFAPFCMKQELEILHPEVVEKSYPDFWKDFTRIISPKQ